MQAVDVVIVGSGLAGLRLALYYLNRFHLPWLQSGHYSYKHQWAQGGCCGLGRR